LFYFWHEVLEFLPVYKEVCRQTDAEFHLFGRVHGDVDVEGRPLFPEKHRRLLEGLDRLKQEPGVKRHGFSPAEEVRDYLSSADYYVGITAGHSLMSRSEMRTGVVEARQAGCRIVHKKTPAVQAYGMKEGVDYVAVDADDPVSSAEGLLSGCSQSKDV
jgi:hypothetical protein